MKTKLSTSNHPPLPRQDGSCRWGYRLKLAPTLRPLRSQGGSAASTDHSCQVEPNVDKNDEAQQQEDEIFRILGICLVLIAVPQGVMPKLVFHGGGGPRATRAAPPHRPRPTLHSCQDWTWGPWPAGEGAGS